jgi:hypothetical protein
LASSLLAPSSGVLIAICINFKLISPLYSVTLMRTLLDSSELHEKLKGSWSCK